MKEYAKLITIDPQIRFGKPCIPMSQYKKIKELLEELEDIKAFDKAMSRKQHFSPFDGAVKRIRTTEDATKDNGGIIKKLN